MRGIMRHLILVPAVATLAAAQTPQRHFTEGVESRFSRTQPVVHYLLAVKDGDTTGYTVQMVISNAPDTVRLALAKHPEYDDRYFRYLEGLRATPDDRVAITQQDSTVWRVITDSGRATIEYRIALPSEPRPRAAWRPFLSATGGLVGGPHSFMYVVGAELAPAHVELQLPSAWTIATGLTPTSSPRTFYASNAYVLVESPILAGQLDTWRFSNHRVPHTVAYWGPPGRPAFDTAAFRDGVERMVGEAVKLFGRPPYREYVFQFQDQSYGGLEHHNSVSLGAPSDQLASNPNAALPETAHEFIHTWNLMRIRPAEYTGVTYRPVRPVPSLWFSEGLTIFYSDLLLRRAGLPTEEATRPAHLAASLANYLRTPGNLRFSAERVSRAEYNAAPNALGDYIASSHAMGEVLGTMLDLIIRDATDGRRSMDDVMRLMLERTGPGGFTNADVERAVADVCACAVKPFFDAHVRGAQPLDFNKYLGLIGLSAEQKSEAVLRDGAAVPDIRLWAWNPPGDSLLALAVNNPLTIWGQAGLHSGDRLITINGSVARSWPEFRRHLAGARIGDTFHLVVQSGRATAPRTVSVRVSGYEMPAVTVSENFTATEKQRRLREAWLAGR
jgi:predicted metalloprotease with PDZ domain